MGGHGREVRSKMRSEVRADVGMKGNASLIEHQQRCCGADVSDVADE